MNATYSQPRRKARLIRAAITLSIAAMLTTSSGINKVFAATPQSSPAERWSYADVADLFLAAPIVARARIADAIVLKDAAAATARPGTIRYYLVADVTTLIRGQDGLAPRVAFLADVPTDSRGKAPKLKKAEVLLAALPVPGRPGEVRLAARDAMVPWRAAVEARVRSLIASGLTPDAPPRITGIGSAFFSAGNLPGEGETQIFLTTADNRPVSLQVLRRPGFEPRWAMALGEIVDEAARPPEPDTLAWYRLACTLPPTLPPRAVAELSPDDAQAANRDYRFVMQSLGPCGRTRG